MRSSFCALALLLLPAIAVRAHNGQVALAVPMQHITVDGDLSDWPPTRARHALTYTAYGHHPRDAQDLRAHFSIGYNTTENTLYLAIVAEDESIITDAGAGWDVQDGCDIFLELTHAANAPAQQCLIYGNASNAEHAQVAVRRQDGRHYYEWSVDATSLSAGTAQLAPGLVLSVDVAVCDHDEDGSFTWLAWGRGAQKRTYGERRGDVLLVEEEVALGTIKGRIADEEGLPLSRSGARLTTTGLQLDVGADAQGIYTAAIPAGSYTVHWSGNGGRAEAQIAEIKPGTAAEIPLTVHPVPLGTTVPAGPGRTLPAGSGLVAGNWRIFGVSDGLPSSLFHDIAQDSDGHLWIATLYGGVCRYDGRHFTIFTVADGLPGDAVQSILEDRQGNLWFGTGWFNNLGQGVCRYDGETFTTFTVEDGLAHDSVQAILEDRQGNLWFGTYEGVSKFDGERFTTYTVEDGLADNTVTAMLEDEEGDLWFATGWGRSGGRLGGVSKFDGERFTNFTTADGLPSNWVTSLLLDREGDLWIGTLGGGVARYNSEVTGTQRQVRRDSSLFSVFAADDGLAGNRIWSIVEDETGVLWFGGTGGATRYDGETWTSLTIADGLTNNRVTALLEDGEGHIWLATPDGLNRYDDGKLTTYTAANGLVDNHLLSALEDRQGNLWFGSTGGVSRYDGKTWRNFTTADGLAHDWIRPIFEDREGNIWFATQGGLSRYDGESFANITAADGLTYNEVSAILQDDRGHMWFGTRGGGINRYDGAVLQQLSRLDGLADDSVIDLFEDAAGDVWIATLSGLTRYRPYSVPPSIAIVNVVADRRYGRVAQIDLPSSQQYLAFEFHGANLKTRPEAMAYRYRLQSREDWRTTYDERVEYQNLPRGDYVFEVKAVDRDLTYSETPAVVAVHIHLPYERMGWIAVLGLAAGLIAWQAGHLVQRDRRLRDANAELSDEIHQRRRVEDERTRLDEQLRQLRYLYRLRAALGESHTPAEVMQNAGAVLTEVLQAADAGSARFEFDGRTWDFGQAAQDTLHYQRPLAWSERERGHIHLFSTVELSEVQERALLDETAAQLVRVLEAQELLTQLLQSARLVSLGQMAAGVAHELNQPLAAISTVAGDVHLRLDEGQMVEEDRLKEMMHDILGMVERMAGTINHLRTFSRDAADAPPVPFSLNEAVHSSLKVIGTQLKSRGIEVQLELAENLPAVSGHPFQLEQVLLNLLANARDALDERQNGEAKQLCIRTFPQSAARLVAEVEDNGAGIAEENLSRLFEPFFTTKEADRGTGLGLSISYAIVQNHGGQITCESRRGQGTLFRVTLPATEEN